MAASGAAPTCSRRSRSAPTSSSSGGRCCSRRDRRRGRRAARPHIAQGRGRPRHGAARHPQHRRDHRRSGAPDLKARATPMTAYPELKIDFRLTIVAGPANVFSLWKVRRSVLMCREVVGREPHFGRARMSARRHPFGPAGARPEAAHRGTGEAIFGEPRGGARSAVAAGRRRTGAGFGPARLPGQPGCRQPTSKT